MSRTALAAPALLWLTLTCPAADETKEDRVKATLDKAKAAHAKAVDDAGKKLSARFEAELKALDRNKKLPIEQRLARIEALEEEQKGFDDAGLIPWSEPMRAASAKYIASVKAANDEVRKVYTPLIEKHLKEDKKRAAALRDEMLEAIAPKVVANWQFNVGGGARGLLKLLSDGSVNEPRSAATWEIRSDLRLLVKWPAPGTREGYWLDLMTMSQDGMAGAGANQIGTGVSVKRERKGTGAAGAAGP
ncbi:MAG: hypothetical protein K2X87_25515 [Gemmataceae bacterium]|nr:hypothetical protein [Gemmataceae bacterium]